MLTYRRRCSSVQPATLCTQLCQAISSRPFHLLILWAINTTLIHILIRIRRQKAIRLANLEKGWFTLCVKRLVFLLRFLHSRLSVIALVITDLGFRWPTSLRLRSSRSSGSVCSLRIVVLLWLRLLLSLRPRRYNYEGLSCSSENIQIRCVKLMNDITRLLWYLNHWLTTL